jgi:hypothetical protein
MDAGELVELPREALRHSLKALRRMADYELEPPIQRRMLDLGERKEFLADDERAELLSLVEFTEHRMIERLEARLALCELEQAVSVLPKVS